MTRRARKELREEMGLILSNLDQRWVTAASSQLCQNLNKLVDQQIDREIEHLLVFSSFYAGEVDLTDFIAQQISKRKIYLPCINQKDRLDFMRIAQNWATELTPGKFGIPSPKYVKELLYDRAHSAQSLILVPGLAFDAEGERLSRDRGLYDILLRKSEMLSVLKVGVCWSIQVLSKVPAESHQAMVEWVCHEREYFRASNHFDEDFEQ